MLAALGLRRAQDGGAAQGMLDLGATGQGLMSTSKRGRRRACWPRWACGGRRREGRCMACWTWVAQVTGSTEGMYSMPVPICVVVVVSFQAVFKSCRLSAQPLNLTIQPSALTPRLPAVCVEGMPDGT